ncbi:hypothetical protein HDU96_005482, partial [Phlyctochytrium bullatum]
YVDVYTHGDWDVFIPYVLFAYRTTVQPTIKDTPFFLQFGRDARVPADLFFGEPSVQTGEAEEPAISEDAEPARAGDDDDGWVIYIPAANDNEPEVQEDESLAAETVTIPTSLPVRVAVWLVKNMKTAINSAVKKLFDYMVELPPDEVLARIMEKYELDVLYIVHDRESDTKQGGW